MQLKRLALVAEVVSAIAIVVTLVFVVAEMRSSTRAQNAATYQEMARDLQAVLAAIPTELRVKARVRGEELSPVEYRQYLGFTTMALRIGESWWQQWQLGTIDDEVFESYITHTHIAVGGAIAREMWDDMSIRFIPGFRDYIDLHIAENPLSERSGSLPID